MGFDVMISVQNVASAKSDRCCSVCCAKELASAR